MRVTVDHDVPLLSQQFFLSIRTAFGSSIQRRISQAVAAKKTPRCRELCIPSSGCKPGKCTNTNMVSFRLWRKYLAEHSYIMLESSDSSWSQMRYQLKMLNLARSQAHLHLSRWPALDVWSQAKSSTSNCPKPNSLASLMNRELCKLS